MTPIYAISPLINKKVFNGVLDNIPIEDIISNGTSFYHASHTPYTLDNNYYIQVYSGGDKYFSSPFNTTQLFCDRNKAILDGTYGFNNVTVFEHKNLHVSLGNEYFYQFYSRSVPYRADYYFNFSYANSYKDCCPDVLNFNPIVKLLGG